ncbi:NADPH:quinone oxidoreductase family protein [Hwanghaeella sp.]|uniref:NADPH:quinone oxidoreductase family protein n=1 Tax=Hwanghaeella sp. TaxID=2605943 RepID=UPI003CCB7DB3
MKAVFVEAYGPYRNAVLKTAQDTAPEEGEVLVRLMAADVNFPDILVMEGKYQVKPPLPFSPGKAGAGIVEAVGDGVTGIGPGDRVAVQVEYGAYAEKVLVPAQTCYRMPDDMPFDIAAALGLVYQTAYFSLMERAAFKPTDTVLVLGASGGVGMASVQLAKALGSPCVIAGARGAANAAFAREAGADHVVDLGMDNLKDGLRDAVKEITGGHGADIVIDPVGGEANAAALRAMAWCGRMVIVGFASGDIPAIRANYLLVKNIGVNGIQWSDYRERDPAAVAAAQEEIFQLWSAGKLDPIITHRVALDDFMTALDVAAGGKVQGKVVLTLAGD